MFYLDIKKARVELRNGKSIYDMSINVSYYARVSTDKDDQINSLENQKNYFEEMINENKNWIFCGGYIDEGISGTSVNNRKDFLRMIEDASNGKIDLILTKEISRFSRNTIDSIKYTQFLLSCGVIVYFLTDNLNTIYEDSEFRLTIMSSLAQDEIRKLSQRVKFGINRMIKERKLIGGNLTGYYKKNGKYEINPNESKLVKYLFESYVSSKVSLKQIGEDLAKMGFYNTKGKVYSQTTLAKILTNPRYKGYYTARLTEVEDYKTHKKKKIPKENQIIEKDNNIPAIISEELWDRANYLYESRKTNKSRHILNDNRCLNSSKYSCLLYCEHCGNIYIRTAGSNRRENPTWVCKKYKNEGVSFCESPIIKEEYLDELFISVFNKLFYDEMLFDSIYKDYKDIIVNYNSFYDSDYDNKILYLEKQKDKLLDLSLNGLIDNNEFKCKSEKLKLNISNLKNNKDDYNCDNLLNRITLYIKNNINIKNELCSLLKVFVDRVVIEKQNNNRKHVILKVYFKFDNKLIIEELKLI